MTSNSRLDLTALILAPLLLAAGTAVVPTAADERHGTDRGRSLEVLLHTLPDRGRLPVALMLLTLGLAFLVPAAAATARLAGRPPAWFGAALVAVGAPMGVVANVTTLDLLYRASDHHVAHDSAVDVLAGGHDPGVLVASLLYLLLPAGFVVLGTALWRTQAVPRVVAVLVAVGPVLGLVAPEGWLGAVATIPFAVGLCCVAVRANQTRAAREELLPA